MKTPPTKMAEFLITLEVWRCDKNMSTSLFALAKAYTTVLDAFVTKTTKAADKETHTFVGDAMKMIRFVADKE